MNQRNLPPLDLKYTYFTDATVPRLFAEAALSFPDKTALRTEDGEISYSSLLHYAYGVARQLISAGAGRGSLVGLAMPRSASAVGAILGTLFAGCAFVPLDVEGSPESLLHQQIVESNISYVLVKGISCKATAWDHCTSIRIPSTFEQQPEKVEPVETESLPEDPAYVMFTSGSTGVPKGVVVPHRAIVRLVSGQHYLNFSPNETFLLHSPLSFDASTLELWGSLLHGGCLAIAPARAIGLSEYQEMLERYNVTTLWMTSAIFHLVVDHAPNSFCNLRQLIVGGDVIHPKAVQQIQQMHPHLSVVNGYGPTENCTFTACYRIPADFDANASLPIGRPIEHTTAYVLDRDLQPVAEGETGELVTGGSGVALGYLNLPLETAERFIPDPFTPGPKTKMYRTGDRVYRDPSGIIHFLGRMDKEVKVGGRRIDLTELEALVLRIDGVRACVAFAIDSDSGLKELALAVESSSSASAEQHIRKVLATRLPAALLPTHILVSDQLAVNNNGKLDRAVIKESLKDASTHLRSSSTNSSNESALTIALALWQDLLGTRSVGPDDNFFDSGGTSLLLIRLHAKLDKEYPGRISVLDLFQTATVRKLSNLIDARSSNKIDPSEEALLRQPAMQ